MSKNLEKKVEENAMEKNENQVNYEIEEMTAKEAMELSLEECSELLDRHCISYRHIEKFDNNRNTIVILCNNQVLPEVTRDWARQRIKISDRIANTNYVELLYSKKTISFKDYCDLEENVNKGTTGITMQELMTLTGKSEETVRDILFSECYITVADHDPIELVMGNLLEVYLIPIVNEDNQLTGDFRMKYLFTSEAVSAFAENMEYYDMFK